MNTLPAHLDCDLIVIGSGAAGLATAITARKRGLDVVVLEKEPVFGGTTALSGGVLWIPMNPHGRQQNPADTREAARIYMTHETGAYYDAAAVESFLENGPRMAEFFERQTAVKFLPTLYPDYHPDVPGGANVGRSILAAPFDIRGLGKDMARLKPPLKTITFIGMMFNSSNADLKHFFRATTSLASFFYVARRLATHMKEMLLYRRGIHVTSGNALAARLAKSALDLGIPILTSSPAKRVVIDGGRAVAVSVGGDDGSDSGGGERRITARHGVVLACGGFPHDIKRITQAYPHLARGGEHLSPTPLGNTGDGVNMAEALGARVDIRFKDTSAWMPVSRVVYGHGEVGVFPHLLDRYKPGIIGVLRNGQRFTNESNSYHDVGAAMIRACADLEEPETPGRSQVSSPSTEGGSPQRGRPEDPKRETAMWLVCDKPTLARYGIGFVKPAPMPIGRFLRNGYLLKGDTVAELARNAGIDPAGLEQTVREYNVGAVKGEDPAFHRGSTSFNRYLADPQNQPNPCVAPVQTGPYFAVKVIMGDLGTFDGIKTSVVGEVLKRDGSAIAGLYAVGNDRESLMGGNYPGAGITHGPNMTHGFVTANHIADKAGVQP